MKVILDTALKIKYAELREIYSFYLIIMFPIFGPPIPKQPAQGIDNTELIECIDSMLTLGMSPVWYAGVDGINSENVVLATTILQMLASIQPARYKDDLVIECFECNRSVKVIQTQQYGESILKGTVDNVEFNMGKFITIEALQHYINATLVTIYSADGRAKSQAATALQKYVRSFNTTRISEPFGEVPALRDSNLRPVAYRVVPDHWVALPPPCRTNELRSGKYKVVTHENNHYIGLTLKRDTIKTLNPRILGIINIYKLNNIVPQIRINQYYLISKNLGQQNLLLQIHSGYIFNPSHAIALASNIDTLHALNIVHRDIKPENMFFYDGQFYLTDNESMDEVGNFKLGYGTPTYLAPVFMSNEYENNDKNSPLSAYKRDQYTFLMSMMTAYFKCQPKNGEFRLDLITHFVRAMPCNEVLKKELFFFIFQPELNQLSSPLAAYFSQIQTKFSSDYRHRLSPLSFNFKS